MQGLGGFVLVAGVTSSLAIGGLPWRTLPYICWRLFSCA